MKFALFLAAALAAPTVMGTPLPIYTHTVENIDNTTSPNSTHVDIATVAGYALIQHPGTKGDAPGGSPNRPGQFFPPPGKKWSKRTQCKIILANRGLPIWRILRLCGISYSRDYTNIYNLCAQQANAEGVSSKDKYMRCESFKGFGK
ncbi:hypothetical protein OPT61_g4780 [Boeremia exigua]|uniref:Uncharacterized protein n=1 Tax=Boeremia exigua TaxID=749465 RepID=A0ACC2ICV1_9PLEO|nr:hypothetical protein OPT61_g4780 [Boeremia exigua]